MTASPLAAAAVTAAVRSILALNCEPLIGPDWNHARVPFTSSSRFDGGVGITTELPAAKSDGFTAWSRVTSSRSACTSWKATAFAPPAGKPATDLSSNFVPSHAWMFLIVTPLGAASSVTVRRPWKSSTSKVASPGFARTCAAPASVAAAGIDAVMSA